MPSRMNSKEEGCEYSKQLLLILVFHFQSYHEKFIWSLYSQLNIQVINKIKNNYNFSLFSYILQRNIINNCKNYDDLNASHGMLINIIDKDNNYIFY